VSQVTIYLDSETERRMREAAQQAGISRSQWLARLIREKTRNQWPAEVREAVGSWGDFPEAEELRQNSRPDTQREPL
jgi:predicted transcriptional regulator